MKRLTQIFQALLGVVALIFTAIIAAGRLAWRTVRNWWKNRSKWFRRSIVTIIILIPTGFVALIGYLIYDSHFGRDSWNDERLSSKVILHYFNNNTYRAYNIRTQEYTTPQINWVSDVSEPDSLAVYATPNKRGYINIKNGEIVVDAETNDYQKAWVFSEGLAAVMKDGRVGFINAQNEVVIPFQFDYSSKCKMSDFGYLFHDNLCIMTNKEGALGLIDRSGNWVVEPSYDEIWTPHKSGYRVVIKDGIYGVLDSDGNIAFPVEYHYINIVADGVILTRDGKQWQVDFEGNIVHPFMYDATYYLNYPIGYDEEGEIKYAFADYVQYQVGGRYGILNRLTGEPITPAIFSTINMLSENVFEVQGYDKYEYYLIDTNGNEISKE